jgi:diacylglycerol kinase
MAVGDKGGRQGLLESFRNAGAGIRAALSQRNMRIHVAAAVVVIAAGSLLGLTASEWTAVILCIASVLGLELLNTAIEAVVDLASPEPHPLARKAKDAAAGAVLVAALASVAVGLFVFIPAVMRVLA